jgi:hypothetical protein
LFFHVEQAHWQFPYEFMKTFLESTPPTAGATALFAAQDSAWK